MCSFGVFFSHNENQEFAVREHWVQMITRPKFSNLAENTQVLHNSFINPIVHGAAEGVKVSYSC